MWLFMARNPALGGPGWDYTHCMWAPSRKTDGNRWAFWETLLQAREGDLVLHLHGDRDPVFAGYSYVDADGYETADRPADPAAWAFAQTYYRVPLRDFHAFAVPIHLDAVFAKRDAALRAYFSKNRELERSDKRLLFYVIQSNKLQPLMGAYCSEVDTALAQILLADDNVDPPVMWKFEDVAPVVRAQEQLNRVLKRVGRREFSEAVKRNFDRRCCFPGCDIAEDRFLVGLHIARWADVPELRGDPGNGLCLCLHHDKAFEAGMFTLTADYRVALIEGQLEKSAWGEAHIRPFAGQRITLGPVRPSLAALEHHWRRVGFAGAPESRAAAR